MMIIFFALLALAVIFPLLSPGFILTLDATAVPGRIFPADISSSSFIYDGIQSVLSLGIGQGEVQKIILFLIFFLAGLGMARLGKSYFAGILYVINPFVYERIMAGHWDFLLGYAVFPFVVSASRNFCQKPAIKTSVILAVLVTLTVSFATHWTFILAAFFLIYFTVYFVFNRENLFPAVKYFSLFGGLCVLFNLNWLIPVLLGHGPLGEVVSQFSRDDLIAFQSFPDPFFGVIFNLLSGFGFWVEAQKYFIFPKDIIFFWPVISLIFILLAAAGVYKVFKNREKTSLPLAITMVVLFLAALDFAGGIALPAFSETAFWLYEKFPFLIGLREPQKLVAVIMFGYAYFGSYGLSFLADKVKPAFKYALLGFFCLLPFIYTPTMFGGFWGQLKPVSYPQSWSKVNDKLNEDKDDYLTLFLPWHQYMRFGFANNLVVANPAPRFFTKPILASENYETKSLYSHDVRPEALHIEGLLSMEKEGVNLTGDQVFDRVKWGESTAVINVKYIILVKESDWETYKFLDKSPDLNKIYEDNYLILYYNTLWQKL